MLNIHLEQCAEVGSIHTFASDGNVCIIRMHEPLRHKERSQQRVIGNVTLVMSYVN